MQLHFRWHQPLHSTSFPVIVNFIERKTRVSPCRYLHNDIFTVKTAIAHQTYEISNILCSGRDINTSEPEILLE